MIDSKLDSIKLDFVKYLDSLGLSSKSHKNYRSDLNHFVAWAILKMRSFGSFVENLTEVVPFLNSRIAEEYMSFMKQNNYPDKTINRRLSTLRHLSRFLTASQVIDIDFMAQIGNVSSRKSLKSKVFPTLAAFQTYLEEQKVSPSTTKNYVSDIRQFLSWLEASRQPQTTDN